MKTITENRAKTVIKYVTEEEPVIIYLSDDGLFKHSNKYEVEKYEATKDIKHKKISLNNYEYGHDAYLVENEEQRRNFEQYFYTTCYNEDVRIPINQWFTYKVTENNDYPDDHDFYIVDNIIKELQQDINALDNILKGVD